ncbi:hypothetical protein M1146_07090 [Patescibacteria group bacterium]|nr:hypothetical protein [Patescibacteria group bacterium]
MNDEGWKADFLGIKIFGIPWSGHAMAFHTDHEGEDMRQKFNFPDETDFLVTHVRKNNSLCLLFVFKQSFSDSYLDTSTFNI